MDSNSKRQKIRRANSKNIPQADGGKAAIRSRGTPLEQQSRRRIQRIVIGAVSFLTVITLYTVISNLPENNPVLMPPPQLVLTTLWKRILDVSMIEATLSSLKRVAIGYFVGAGSAIIIGTLMLAADIALAMDQHCGASLSEAPALPKPDKPGPASELAEELEPAGADAPQQAAETQEPGSSPPSWITRQLFGITA